MSHTRQLIRYIDIRRWHVKKKNQHLSSCPQQVGERLFAAVFVLHGGFLPDQEDVNVKPPPRGRRFSFLKIEDDVGRMTVLTEGEWTLHPHLNCEWNWCKWWKTDSPESVVWDTVCVASVCVCIPDKLQNTWNTWWCQTFQAFCSSEKVRW